MPRVSTKGHRALQALSGRWPCNSWCSLQLSRILGARAMMLICMHAQGVWLRDFEPVDKRPKQLSKDQETLGQVPPSNAYRRAASGQWSG